MSGGFGNKDDDNRGLTAAEELWVQTGSAGVLLLTEQASAPSATSGVGKVYVKSSDNLLYFKDDSGTEYLLSVVGGGGYQAPTGTVNGINAVFTFAIAPNAIVVDNVPLRKVASDGTINWTGTTVITLSVAPNFDIYATA